MEIDKILGSIRKKVELGRKLRESPRGINGKGLKMMGA